MAQKQRHIEAQGKNGTYPATRYRVPLISAMATCVIVVLHLWLYFLLHFHLHSYGQSRQKVFQFGSYMSRVPPSQGTHHPVGTVVGDFLSSFLRIVRNIFEKVHMLHIPDVVSLHY